MKREEILSRLGYTVPDCKKKRVIIVSDINCEADDPFAIMQHLLTPSFDIRGIIACHFEYGARMAEEMLKNHPELREQAEKSEKMTPRFTSTEKSYEEGKLILKLAGIDDVPLFRGTKCEISDRLNPPESEGADFIIQEALRDDPNPLYVCMLGAETDLAIAYLKCPEIAEHLTAVGILGGPYPSGGWEFNLIGDVESVNVLFESPIPYWQIPMNVYGTSEISFAELVRNVRPCGEIGRWLVSQMFAFQQKMAERERPFPNAEIWSIGDNPTAGVLLQGEVAGRWHTEKAPYINADCSYTPNPEGREIRVYDSYNSRLTIHDLFAKLQLCYGE